MIPSWIIGLTDPVLKADFESFSGAGSITEAEIGEALTGLAAEDEKSGATLSASQFADLQLMASNIGAMGASPYLQSITDALVYGDAANATWTGGGSKSVKLGNLAVGSTTTQLGELIDKWFYGADLPIDKVVMTGYASVTVTYSAVDAPLFGPDGPKMSDINQGYLGDCYLLASLAEVAKKNPSAITSMITDNNNGTYGVRFYVDGIARYVTVNNELADGGTEFNSATNIWASVVETAFAEVQDQGLITGNGKYNKGNSFSSIANGGVSANALEAITDATEITNFAAKDSNLTWTAHVYDQALTQIKHHAGLSTAEVLSTVAADLLIGDDVDLNSAKNARFANGKRTLIDDHVMSIFGYDALTGKLQIRNPWGVESGQNWATTFQIKLRTLLADGDSITVDNVGTATSVQGASVVASSALQNMAQVASFSVTDSVADIYAGFPQVISDSKLTSLTAIGTTGGDTLDLIGLDVPATINMEGNTDAASMSGGVLHLGSGFDSIALGFRHATVDYSLNGGGVEFVADFNAIHDLLSISLSGGSLQQTFVDGGDWISSSTDMSHGVFLANVTSAQKVTVSHGIATVV